MVISGPPGVKQHERRNGERKFIPLDNNLRDFQPVGKML